MAMQYIIYYLDFVFFDTQLLFQRGYGVCFRGCQFVVCDAVCSQVKKKGDFKIYENFNSSLKLVVEVKQVLKFYKGNWNSHQYFFHFLFALTSCTYTSDEKNNPLIREKKWFFANNWCLEFLFSYLDFLAPKDIFSPTSSKWVSYGGYILEFLLTH